MAMSEELDRITGPGIENRPEVIAVKAALGKKGIFLEGFGITVTAVYLRPRPYGFDFRCDNPEGLIAMMKAKSAFNKDDESTLEGAFSAGDTHGQGFREIGYGPRLHMEIGLDHKCNVHIDSHGYVAGKGEYDWNRSLEHGYWDLGADKVPGLYGSFGDKGQVGPMIRPIVDVDGKIRWTFGLTGHW
jgi:hypothetical protein